MLVLPSMEPGQSSNIRYICAVLVAHCPPSRRLKDVAPKSMQHIFVTPETSQQPIPAPVKDSALWNVQNIVVTRETFHRLRSSLKRRLPPNRLAIEVMSLTSQSLMGPYLANAASLSSCHRSAPVYSSPFRVNLCACREWVFRSGSAQS